MTKGMPEEIKNIIFDIGNVLISYQPEEFHAAQGTAEERIKTYISDIYEGREWQMLDRGTITLRDAIDSIAKRSPLSAAEIASVFEMRDRLLFPLNGNTKLLKPLKNDGIRIFYLSNFPEDMFALLSKRYDFFNEFEGGVVSSHVKLLKPEPEIYRLLLGKYELVAEESLFIDDLERNIEGAARSGFKTLHLPDHRRLKSELQTLFPGIFAED